MRYFTQDERFFGTDFNRDEYIEVEQKENKYSWTFKKTKEIKSKFKDNKKTGERKWERPINNPIVEGYWQYAGLFSGETIPEPPKDYPKNYVFPVDENLQPSQITETITIIRELTAEEKAERQREKEQKEKEQREAQEKAEQKDTYIKVAESEISLDVRVPNKKYKENASHRQPFIKVNNEQATCNIPNLADDDLDLAIVNKIYLDGRLETLKQEIIDELRNK